jgi:peptide/nickel transport system permease protein
MARKALRSNVAETPRGRRFSGVARFVLGRIALGVLTLFLVSVIIFAATQVLPGDAARAILGRNATPETLAELRHQLHLDEPVVHQYTDWLMGILRLDLGQSLVQAAPGLERPVTEVIGSRIGNSAMLFLLATLVSVPLSVLLGSIAALRRDRIFDHVTSITTLVFASLPEFVIGIALVLVFGTGVFQLLPSVSIIDPGRSVWHQLDKVILPAATLVLAVIPHITRIVRASMIEVLESDYVEMARLKGLPERLIIWRHALPNAIAPAIQITALSLAWIAGGVVLVEFVFGYAGIGAGLVEAVALRDVPVVQALALLIAAIYIFLNLAGDAATVFVSPRLRTSLQ